MKVAIILETVEDADDERVHAFLTSLEGDYFEGLKKDDPACKWAKILLDVLQEYTEKDMIFPNDGSNLIQ